MVTAQVIAQAAAIRLITMTRDCHMLLPDALLYLRFWYVAEGVLSCAVYPHFKVQVRAC